MNIAIIGAGSVGRTLGRAWQRYGVVFGLRHPSSERIAELSAAIGRRASVASVAEAAANEYCLL